MMAGRRLPLAGKVVLDLSRVLAGPFCGLLLADMGADVIKVENPAGGDDSRQFSLPSHGGHSVYFLTINRNKRSVALDLKHAAGRAAFLQLVANADVVLENFRTGVMERFGLGYETLKAVRPQLIYCAISGYGRSGPNRDVPGYDPVAQAESGLMSMTGEPDGPALRTGPSLADMVCGLYAANAVSSTLVEVESGGEGRFIEVSLHESGLNMLINFAGNFLISGAEPTRAGNINQVAQPAGVYQAADGPLMITIGNDRQFARLCRDVLGQAELAADDRFVDNRSRVANAPALTALLNAALAGQPCAHWVAVLRTAGIPVGAVATVAAALSSELVRARGIVRDVSHADLGRYPALMGPVRLAGSDRAAPRGAPLLGEHTRQVLVDLGNLAEQEVERLIEAGVARDAS